MTGSVARALIRGVVRLPTKPFDTLGSLTRSGTYAHLERVFIRYDRLWPVSTWIAAKK